ncbi:bifunctional 3-(3-hydroxy-phenyl)propionate/3-hydroxycinnamic acid hydroxylase [Micromonospora sp. NPDC049903]|uniref:bifunctional 3-(3-hydroxy-phenyl)propionate/3-hydroxycinnamic acid hydroxylase n=1 Tax=Micromonospora sp. NPDC049903 TaxID=3364276 RepID=UPI0037A5E21E
MTTDVLIVGYGPVGQVLALLLAQRGHRVTVLEKWQRPFPMPRAVSFDGESARILAAAGVGRELGDAGEPSRDYIWRNARGDVLLSVDVAEHGQCGWPDSTSMYQPGLEEALARRGADHPSLTVLRGREVVEITEESDACVVTAADRSGSHTIHRARWLVGCDGANSFVRSQMGVDEVDLGFSNDWLTCDVTLREPRVFTPNNLQICDPVRPTTAVSAGPGHRRWEFMRVPGETVAELDSREAAWRLLAPFDIHPGNAVLARHAVYTFQARYAERWRAGRMLIAGDAAHRMPPFAGQGMCSGFRDAANLAWKLDLVLSGHAGDALLDTYEVERRAHVQHAILMSVNLGRVICQPDPAAAADRDAAMLANRRRMAGRPQDPPMYQPLTTGLRADSRAAGWLVPQGRVTAGGVTGLFDDVVGRGLILLVTPEVAAGLSGETVAFLRARDGQVVVLGEGSGQWADTEGTYRRLLARAGCRGLLVRPDHYVYGGGRTAAELDGVVAELRRSLTARVSGVAR